MEVSSSSMVLYVHRNRRVCYGQANRGVVFFRRFYVHRNHKAYYGQTNGGVVFSHETVGSTRNRRIEVSSLMGR